MIMGLGGVLIILIAISILSLINLSSLASKVDEVVQERSVQAKYANEVVRSINGVIRNVQAITTASTDEGRRTAMERIQENRKNLRESLDNLTNITTTPEGKDLIDRFKKEIIAGTAVNNRIIELSNAKKNSDAQSLYNAEMENRYIPAMFAAADAILKYNEMKLKEANNSAAGTYKNTRSKIITIIISVGVSGTAIATILSLVFLATSEQIEVVADSVRNKIESIAGTKITQKSYFDDPEEVTEDGIVLTMSMIRDVALDTPYAGMERNALIGFISKFGMIKVISTLDILAIRYRATKEPVRNAILSLYQSLQKGVAIPDGYVSYLDRMRANEGMNYVLKSSGEKTTS